MTRKREMIEKQLKGRDIHDEGVLRAMHDIDRELFVPDEYRPHAYDDAPLPIGREQTISQPYMVAYMAQAIDPQPDEKVLEVGTGCGYNAAVLSRLVSQVYSIEIIGWLAELARENLEKAGIENVTVRYSDGFGGWPEKGPFDAIMLTAATPEIPSPLKEQLKTGGKLLAPVGVKTQSLDLFEKIDRNNFRRRTLLPVRFVPMTGQTQT